MWRQRPRPTVVRLPLLSCSTTPAEPPWPAHLEVYTQCSLLALRLGLLLRPLVRRLPAVTLRGPRLLFAHPP